MNDVRQHILVIEDDASLSRGLADVLAAQGFTVTVAPDAARGLEAIRSLGPQLVLLDVGLPDRDGFSILAELRAAGSTLPVILLTARGLELDKVRAFELGGDDYVTKPFSVLELIGRIRAVLRRLAPTARPASRLILGEVVVDFEAGTLALAGQPLEVPARMLDVLRYLHLHHGTIVTRDQLIDGVWGEDQNVNHRTIDNLIARLRKLIEPQVENPSFIRTVHGKGYRLVLPGSDEMTKK